MVPTDPEKPGKPGKTNLFYQSQGKVKEKIQELIKVREKSGIFFIPKAVYIYFLSFLRMINFFLVYFLRRGLS